MATPNSGNPANKNSGYTSFMQPGNSPDNYRTSYGSDSAGRNMVTAPKPGGPILKLTEGGNLPKTPTFSGGIRDRAITPPDRGNNSNRSVGAGIASNLFNNAKSYVTNIGRSVRDLPTAVGTVLDTPYLGQVSTGKSGERANAGAIPGVQKGLAPLTNYAKQVAQTFGAVAGGVKDNSRSEQYSGPTKGTYGEGNPYAPTRKGQASGGPISDVMGGAKINGAAPRFTGAGKPKKPKTGGSGNENSQVK